LAIGGCRSLDHSSHSLVHQFLGLQVEVKEESLVRMTEKENC
jgi:hypothetical protein